MPSPKSGSVGRIARSFLRKEVAEDLNCSVKTVDRRIASGELIGMRMGRLIRISEDELRTYKMRCRIKSPAG